MENEGSAGTGSSPRWNPTKEQITLLENLYKQGIRTPSADQIQQITGRLRAHGHIEVGCVNPYYLHQVRDHHDQHGSVYRQDLHSSKVMLPSGGYEKRTTTDHKKHVSDITTTTARMSMSSSSLRFDRFALDNHGYFSEGINVNTNGLKTLPLFPLQPLDAANDSGVGNSSFSLRHDSPVTYCGDDGGRGQPFIDFFSSGSSRFDNSGNGL
ncbi:hypothetical protein YC2023_118783 [Brassica napus]|uniref:Homeobox domain-containing protein n=2 Tax=Brassica TaxID=3705 RepID=A0A3P6EK21_BRAOL|nr:unnamed protein product [Brassica napus]CAF1770290.1 unnamed protein product [Brassica napus]VDD32712.1 unnamed protein product [Brassica oleracea]